MTSEEERQERHEQRRHEEIVDFYFHFQQMTETSQEQLAWEFTSGSMRIRLTQNMTHEEAFGASDQNT